MFSFKILLLITAFLRAVHAQDACPKAPTFPDTVSNCNLWHTIVSGDTCYSVEQKFGITSKQFLQWNPSVSSDCLTNFWLGEAYCVGVGSKKADCSKSSSTSSTSRTSTSSSRSSHPTTSSTTTQNATYSTRFPITSYNLTTPTVGIAWPPTRTKGGQPSYCRSWHLVNSGDTCQSIVNRNGGDITLDDLQQWNPTLGSDCSGLSPLLQQFQTLTGASQTSAGGDKCDHPESDLLYAADNYLRGLCLHAIANTGGHAERLPVVLSRPSPLQFGSFQASDFMKWNPSVGSDCGGLEMGLYYCVAIDGTPSTRTAPFSATTTAASSTSLPKGCADTWFVGVDDTCQSITDYKNIPLASFIKWNPQLNAHNSTDCQVAPNTYVCVGSSDGATTTDLFSSTATGTATSSTSSTRTTSSSTTTRVAVSTPAPTQAGMVQGCMRFYYVEEGDGCWQIVHDANIDLGTFLSWNPGAKSDCSGLWLHSYCCIGISGPVTTITSGTAIPAPTL
ncbi:uncharacterized protein E0L32_009231 [Thyridium curvatum]|uniref:LysM domain-containing protein n=1 Tax=Thyridium curvatum TaxID=1093900 RepID=A0A507AZH8_9PEZI|nr:uncharacterized protein E0L32_009231 [Thyridium curvatum]TPX09630.1 hypothetical protein E0L32_009231 [Thyridium curvatum]